MDALSSIFASKPILSLRCIIVHFSSIVKLRPNPVLKPTSTKQYG